ncbi:hypothetical protein CEUSTIGMA_g10745.t1 [Chlamydomonas eustigma]|uniref:Uncharacterized protein n=1 Tax=Chlamydomonas eustigma TaxID=1157962 RepID=A0A250XK62_9CHLO|nr:hypothetical protein CEUSTIGMA_g10745.t1 [Chlamydomonas eustigma]|eukprot:GAX83319.1 hypothetical protein CEUSTIGMA_g10745.t1 [Chlamydomonas eustigma]
MDQVLKISKVVVSVDQSMLTQTMLLIDALRNVAYSFDSALVDQNAPKPNLLNNSAKVVAEVLEIGPDAAGQYLSLLDPNMCAKRRFRDYKPEDLRKLFVLADGRCYDVEDLAADPRAFTNVSELDDETLTALLDQTSKVTGADRDALRRGILGIGTSPVDSRLLKLTSGCAPHLIGLLGLTLISDDISDPMHNEPELPLTNLSLFSLAYVLQELSKLDMRNMLLDGIPDLRESLKSFIVTKTMDSRQLGAKMVCSYCASCKPGHANMLIQAPEDLSLAWPGLRYLICMRSDSNPAPSLNPFVRVHRVFAVCEGWELRHVLDLELQAVAGQLQDIPDYYRLEQPIKVIAKGPDALGPLLRSFVLRSKDLQARLLRMPSRVQLERKAMIIAVSKLLVYISNENYTREFETIRKLENNETGSTPVDNHVENSSLVEPETTNRDIGNNTPDSANRDNRPDETTNRDIGNNTSDEPDSAKRETFDELDITSDEPDTVNYETKQPADQPDIGNNTQYEPETNQPADIGNNTQYEPETNQPADQPDEPDTVNHETADIDKLNFEHDFTSPTTNQTGGAPGGRYCKINNLDARWKLKEMSGQGRGVRATLLISDTNNDRRAIEQFQQDVLLSRIFCREPEFDLNDFHMFRTYVEQIASMMNENISINVDAVQNGWLAGPRLIKALSEQSDEAVEEALMFLNGWRKRFGREPMNDVNLQMKLENEIIRMPSDVFPEGYLVPQHHHALLNADAAFYMDLGIKLKNKREKINANTGEAKLMTLQVCSPLPELYRATGKFLSKRALNLSKNDVLGPELIESDHDDALHFKFDALARAVLIAGTHTNAVQELLQWTWKP